MKTLLLPLFLLVGFCLPTQKQQDRRKPGAGTDTVLFKLKNKKAAADQYIMSLRKI
ncbi:MAG: hypothetical protein JWQ84_1512 [Mucilaginibacter sp.]|nr:hypothetical protein [Mucilaginibacter sp.]